MFKHLHKQTVIIKKSLQVFSLYIQATLTQVTVRQSTDLQTQRGYHRVNLILSKKMLKIYKG